MVSSQDCECNCNEEPPSRAVRKFHLEGDLLVHLPHFMREKGRRLKRLMKVTGPVNLMTAGRRSYVLVSRCNAWFHDTLASKFTTTPTTSCFLLPNILKI